MTNDYISREAAIETLDEQVALCDKALKSFEISLKDEYAVKVERASLVAYKEQLEALPSADVVQVVRCKDCRKCSYDPLFNYYWCNLTLGTRRVKSDDFCSYGEREE